MRPKLRARTTALLNALADHGPGGAAADQLAATGRMRTRQAAARLRWLARAHLVRYSRGTGLWHLPGDSLFPADQIDSHDSAPSPAAMRNAPHDPRMAEDSPA